MVAALLTLLGTGSAAQAVESPQIVASDAETAPVFHSGDAMDDPAIWVHPTEPSQSLLMGNDKGGGFETYDLDGTLVQRLPISSQFWGNVDVRQGVTVNGITQDLVGVVQRGVRFYTVDPSTRMLSSITEGGEPIGVNGEGFCLYQSPTTQKVYGISITIAGHRQPVRADRRRRGRAAREHHRADLLRGVRGRGLCRRRRHRRALHQRGERGALALLRRARRGTTRTAVDVLASAGGHLINDIEGVTLVDQPDGKGFVIVSAQNALDPNASYFSVYRREGTNEFVKSFRVGNGTNSDDCDRTDGITAITADLGPAFPAGHVRLPGQQQRRPRHGRATRT